MTDDLSTMRRITLAQHARFKSGLTQKAFSQRYGIPIGTLRDWEQSRFEPDETAASYLKAIADGLVSSTGWRPIASAPKDGTPVDLWLHDLGQRIADCVWDDRTEQWQVPESSDGMVTYIRWDAADQITHWLPSPSPPIGPDGT